MSTVYRVMSPEEMSALVMMSVHDEAEFTRLAGFVPNSKAGRFRRAAGGLMVAAMFWSTQYWRLRSCRESCAAALLAAESDAALVDAARRLAEVESLLAGADEALDAFAAARGVTPAALRNFAQADDFEPMTSEPACAELRDTLLKTMLQF
ncbi:MAG: hypothetical protein AB9M53_09850 [Leptothrix sp. (in: b-proteobacteria)]